MSNTNWWKNVSFFGLNQDFLLTYEGNTSVSDRAAVLTVGFILVDCSWRKGDSHHEVKNDESTNFENGHESSCLDHYDQGRQLAEVGNICVGAGSGQCA